MGWLMHTNVSVDAVAHRRPAGARSRDAGEERPAPRGSSKPTRATPSAQPTATACGAHEATTGWHDTRVVCWLEPILALDVVCSLSATRETRTEECLNEICIRSVFRGGREAVKLR